MKFNLHSRETSMEMQDTDKFSHKFIQSQVKQVMQWVLNVLVVQYLN